MPEKKLQIRNSTVDLLIFMKDSHEEGIEVRVQDNNVWLTQKAISELFDVERSVVTKHLKRIFESVELDEASTCAFFAQVADNGKTYRYKFYTLPAIIAVGYRVNSQRATQFRQWATKVLDTFTKQGYVLDKTRLINGQIFDEDYFDHLKIVIELDGVQHYSDGEIQNPGDRYPHPIASTEKYASMVSAHREMTLAGYEVYRFGGKEFQHQDVARMIRQFFIDLLAKHGITV